MKTILSRQNPLIKHVAQLQQSKNRVEYQECIAEGLRTCYTLITSGLQLKYLFATEAMMPHAQELLPDNTITHVNDEVMAKISTTKNPSGILGVFSIPSSSPVDMLSSGIVLAQVSDPGNMGTLIRSCAAMGQKTVVVIEGVDPWSPKVIHASAGTIGLVNIFQLSWNQLIEHKKDLSLCALVVSGGQNPSVINFKNTLLIIGNEAHGIPTEWLQNCDTKLTLPMPGEIESLNAAVAGSIALYLAFAL
jgi:TrmH family RNA methyltransferase